MPIKFPWPFEDAAAGSRCYLSHRKASSDGSLRRFWSYLSHFRAVCRNAGSLTGFALKTILGLHDTRICCDPLPFKETKAAALTMTRGACGEPPGAQARARATKAIQSRGGGNSRPGFRARPIARDLREIGDCPNPRIADNADLSLSSQNDPGCVKTPQARNGLE